MPPRLLIRLIVALVMLVPAIPAVAFAQTDDEVVVVSDNFDDPSVGILQEGSDDPDLRYDYDDDGYEIDAFADDFSGDLTVPVPGTFPNGRISIDAVLTGTNDGNGHYLFLACRVRDDTGYKFEIRPLAGVAAVWLLSPQGNQRIANVGLDGDPSSGPFRIEFSCEGNELTGRIDGAEIVSITDSTYDEGSFAFGAGVYKLSAGPVSADFDNLTISVPADEVPPEATPEPTQEPTVAITPEATETPVEIATSTPTDVPTEQPTEEPTQAPTEEPTQTPIQEPTAVPTEASVSLAASFDRSGLAAAANQLREQAGAQPPVYGPESGQTDFDTGQQLGDFVASATFTVPDSGEWSAGYAFRQTADNSALLLISSNGAWMLTAGTEQVRAAGLVEALDSNAGDGNTIELIASGDTGYLTVNGEFAAQLDLSIWPDAGDVSIIGSIADAGGPLEVADAAIWLLGESVAPVEAETPVATEEAATETPLESPEATVESASPEASVVSQQDAAATFDAIVASTDGQDPLSGPDSGTLRQAIGSLDIASAGVITENFYSTVRFANPASANDPDHPWDIVIGFWHTGGDDQVRLVIASDGTWSLALGTARPIANGTVDNLNLGGARGNDIALAVLGGVGYLSVNGEFVTTIDIPSQPKAGDIWLASGTFPEDAQEGVQTPYSDWMIWSLEQG